MSEATRNPRKFDAQQAITLAQLIEAAESALFDAHDLVAASGDRIERSLQAAIDNCARALDYAHRNASVIAQKGTK